MNIKIGLVSINSGDAKFQILEQDEALRCDPDSDGSDGKILFSGECGEVRSVSSPEFIHDSKILFIRGCCHARDNNSFSVEIDHLEEFFSLTQEAGIEINNMQGIRCKGLSITIRFPTLGMGKGLDANTVTKALEEMFPLYSISSRKLMGV